MSMWGGQTLTDTFPSYHFGALESCGRIWFERRQYPKAAEFFRHAVEINPNLWNVVDVLRKLDKMLENDRI